MRLTDHDHQLIADAIRTAEQTTSGEIFCVLARRVSAYGDVSLAWAAAAALILPLLLIPAGFEAAWIPGLAENWTTAHLAAEPTNTARALAAYAIVQAAVFAVVFVISRFPPVLRLLTPPPLRRERVRQAALRQFLAHGLHTTQDRTGVLIFAAASERKVEIVADEGIHAKVDTEVWGQAIDSLAAALKRNRPADGFTAAISLCGSVLAQHFPPRAVNANEKPDRLVEM